MKKSGSDKTAYLTFSVTGGRYGIDASIVQEVVLVPKISPLELAPPFIVGVFNLRGKTVPVMNLAIRLGRDNPGRYSVFDSIIILKHGDRLFSILANKILGMVELAASQVDQAPDFGEWEDERTDLISGIYQAEDELTLILDKDEFFSLSMNDIPAIDDALDAPSTATKGARAKLPHSTSASVRDLYFNDLTEEDEAMLGDRAERLRVSLESESTGDLMAIAVIELSGEKLGVELDSVQGFSLWRQITQIPCCPPHIVGSMNLRGDNLTVVDIRALLGVPVGNEQSMPTIMIVLLESHAVGVPIHGVMDVIHVPTNQLTNTPIAGGTLDRKHLKGLVPYGEKLLTIVDVQGLLSSDMLVVNEEA